jgi:hypothetical protein
MRRRAGASDGGSIGVTGVFIQVIVVAYLFFIIWMEVDGYMVEQARNEREKATGAAAFGEVNVPDEL